MYKYYKNTNNPKYSRNPVTTRLHGFGLALFWRKHKIGFSGFPVFRPHTLKVTVTEVATYDHGNGYQGANLPTGNV